MDLAYKQEATVGTLVILAFVLFFVGTTWLSGRSVGTDSDDFYRIEFRDASNLKASSVVRISGVDVGKVEKISLADVGKVLVLVSLPEKITPRVDATASVVAVGFVGDAAVEFDPGRAPQPLPHDRVIIGTHEERADRPGRPAERPGRQRAARRAVHRQPEDGGRAVRDLERAAGHAEGDPAHDDRAERHPLRAVRRIDQDHGLVPFAQHPARQHAGQSGAGPDARPRRHPHGQPGGDDLAAHHDQRQARHACSRA